MYYAEVIEDSRHETFTVVCSCGWRSETTGNDTHAQRMKDRHERENHPREA